MQTVGALVTVALAAGRAASLAAIEITYVVRRRTSPVYLADAAVELAALDARRR